jgi:hypothetical protein
MIQRDARPLNRSVGAIIHLVWVFRGRFKTLRLSQLIVPDIAGRGRFDAPFGGAAMSVTEVLLPVFLHVLLVFILLFWMGKERRDALVSRDVQFKDVALDEPNWPKKATQLGNCLKNQFEFPMLFYAIVAIALPLRQADLIFVLLSWVFVVTRYVHAGIFVTSNNMKNRSLAFFAGVIVLLIMWILFAFRMLRVY